MWLSFPVHYFLLQSYQIQHISTRLWPVRVGHPPCFGGVIVSNNEASCIPATQPQPPAIIHLAAPSIFTILSLSRNKCPPRRRTQRWSKRWPKSGVESQIQSTQPASACCRSTVAEFEACRRSTS